jgi:hypothetical protein
MRASPEWNKLIAKLERDGNAVVAAQAQEVLASLRETLKTALKHRDILLEREKRT